MAVRSHEMPRLTWTSSLRMSPIDATTTSLSWNLPETSLHRSPWATGLDIFSTIHSGSLPCFSERILGHAPFWVLCLKPRPPSSMTIMFGLGYASGLMKSEYGKNCLQGLPYPSGLSIRHTIFLSRGNGFQTAYACRHESRFTKIFASNPNRTSYPASAAEADAPGLETASMIRKTSPAPPSDVRSNVPKAEPGWFSGSWKRFQPGPSAWATEAGSKFDSGSTQRFP